MEDGVVLKFCGYDVLFSLPAPKRRSRKQGLVVRLAAPGGEGNLSGIGIDPGGDPLAGGKELLRSHLSACVQAGGISPKPVRSIQKYPFCRLAHGCGGGVVHINHNIVLSVDSTAPP